MPHRTSWVLPFSLVVLSRSNSRAGSTGFGEPEEEEPDWDLPPDLQEYTGNPGNRKAQLAFRQAQTVRRTVTASVPMTYAPLFIPAVNSPIAWASIKPS